MFLLGAFHLNTQEVLSVATLEFPVAVCSM